MLSSSLQILKVLNRLMGMALSFPYGSLVVFVPRGPSPSLFDEKLLGARALGELNESIRHAGGGSWVSQVVDFRHVLSVLSRLVSSYRWC